MIQNIQNIHTAVVNPTLTGSVVKPSAAMDFIVMGKFQDLSGRRFGRLLVNKRVPNKIRGVTIWECLCDCGKLTTQSSQSIKAKLVLSCGCYHRDALIKRQTKHGGHKSTEYTSWEQLKRRCLNVNSPAYKYYGGRGIKVCDRWLHSFENFLADMGKKPSKSHSIDRINSNGNYEPSNCRWATKKEQSNNTSHCIYATINGETMSVTQWCERLGKKRPTIYKRIRVNGLSPEEAILIDEVNNGGKFKKHTQE